METNGYAFDRKLHAHTLDGKPLFGVTSVLGDIIAKGDGLVHWAWKLGKEGKDWREQRDTAGTQGTDVHAWIEGAVKYAIENNGGFIREDAEGFDKQTNHFISWAKKNAVRFLDSERHVYSREFWIGGICDLMFEMKGLSYVGDIKTSKSVYWSQFLQMGAYQLCIEEMTGESFDGSIIIRLGKDGSFETQESLNPARDRDGFIHALELYKIKKSFG